MNNKTRAITYARKANYSCDFLTDIVSFIKFTGIGVIIITHIRGLVSQLNKYSNEGLNIIINLYKPAYSEDCDATRTSR